MPLLGTVHYEVRDGVALLTVDNPPVNPLSSGVRYYMAQHMETALADPAVRAIVITGAGRAFIAGADIRDFGRAGDADTPQPKRAAGAYIEESRKPVVAAINGTAFGGGFELALTCHFRVLKPGAEVGLPEIRIGLLPGGGGTQRLPRLIGAEAAATAILTGDPFPSERALALGLVDAILDDADFVAAAVAWARRVADERRPLSLVRDRREKLAADRARPGVLDAAKQLVATRMRGQFNGAQALACVQAAMELDDFDAGMRVERERFAQCLAHPQRAAMIHVFFAERTAARPPQPAMGGAVPAPRPVARGATIGGGLMGGGIAMCFANAGIPVRVLEVDRKALDAGLATIAKNYDSQVRRGRITASERDARMGLISGSLSYEDLGDVDLVIEAVYENIDVKVDVFRRLDAHMRPGAILASNTSGLDIDRMATATRRPADVVGMHFFSPANVMRLLEVVQGAQTAPDVLATALAVGKRMDKAGVVSRNAPGFIGNRMLGGYTSQAAELVLRGATPWQVDRVIVDFGMPMGPFQMSDLVGLDLTWRARKLAGQKAEDLPPARRIADALAEMGRFGQKNGRGFYVYDDARRGTPDPEVEQLALDVARSLGIERRTFTDEEVLKRCLYPLVNAGAEVLEQGIAQRPSDIDIVYVHGYGFPKYRGGPMFWADQAGLASVLADLRRFQAESGDFWRPRPLIERLVAEGKGFASLNPR
jgi:3-hydroxyacyl-CoA dehydrogenase